MKSTKSCQPPFVRFMYVHTFCLFSYVLFFRRLSLALGLLFSKENVLAADPIRIEYLQEIPRGSWADSINDILLSAPVPSEDAIK